MYNNLFGELRVDSQCKNHFTLQPALAAVGDRAVRTRVSATTATAAAIPSPAPASVSQDSLGNTVSGVSCLFVNMGNLPNQKLFFLTIPSRKTSRLCRLRSAQRVAGRSSFIGVRRVPSFGFQKSYFQTYFGLNSYF